IIKSNPNSPDAKVRVYTADQIIGFAERFPSLVLWVKEFSPEGLSFQIWAKNRDVSIPETFILDKLRESILKNIQEEIRNAKTNTPIFRIMGLSGLGKTRLIFETLKADDLQNKTIYVSADSFKNSNLFYHLLNEEETEAILVIDECSLENHEYFVRNFSKRGSRLSVITISHEFFNVSPPSLSFELESLSMDDIKNLLTKEFEGLQTSVINRIAGFSDGYPQVAFLLAEAIYTGFATKEDILTVDNRSLLNKLIAGTLDINSDWFRKVKKVLMGLALFEKVGYKGAIINEAKWVANFININWDEFQVIVKEQRPRGIIKGEFYIYVKPFFLAIHLIKEWWEIYGDRFDFKEFTKKVTTEVSRDMLNRFTNHMPYISSTEAGRELVKFLLSNNGIFKNGSLLDDDDGANFFLKLTEAGPRSALERLKRTIGTWNKSELLNFKKGRRQIVWALEKLVYYKETFNDAVKILIKLAEAENESYANNATGVFTSLFSQAWGEVAPSETSPEERYPILVEAIESSSEEIKKLALKGFAKALDWGRFSRFVGPEFLGRKMPPKFYTPKTWGEVFENYRRVWSYLDENLTKFNEGIRNEIVKIMLNSVRGINNINKSLADMVLKTIQRFISFPWIDKNEILLLISQVIKYDSKELPKEILDEWIKLKNDLESADFSILLKRHIQFNLFEELIIREDQYDYKKIELDIQNRIKGLAEIAFKNPELLGPEYKWLMPEENTRVYQFGYEIGIQDGNFILLNKFLTKQRENNQKGNGNFLAGYFKALFEKDRDLWNENIKQVCGDEALKKFFPNILAGSGTSDIIISKITKLLKKGILEAPNFRHINFRIDPKIISDEIFIELIDYLVTEPSHYGIKIAIRLFIIYYAVYKGGITLQKELTLKILLHPALWDNPKNIKFDHSIDFNWQQIAKIFVIQNPEIKFLIFEQIIKYFEDERSITGSLRYHSREFLIEVIKENPKESWSIITKYLGPPIDRRASALRFFLKEKAPYIPQINAVLEFFNLKDIWSWVDQDIESRAWYLATFIPKDLFHSEKKVCIARELLIRHGDREDVRNSFSANFFTETYSGPSSIHYKIKKRFLLDFKENEDNKNVIRWIVEELDSLEKLIQESKMREERRGF
ncbi:MAG: hypothetical protein HWN66_14185, partial [Candidatus Helarchaeota archaeon]|nr:hypothetical protein [Candidatus Helarchaeota archaeon]